MDFETITFTNQKGVMLLKSGQVKQAIRTFESGLRHLAMSPTNDSDHPLFGSQQDDGDSWSFVLHATNVQSLTEFDLQELASSSWSSSSSLFSFFSEAFIGNICENEGKDDDNGLCDVTDEQQGQPQQPTTLLNAETAMSAALVYNMGLAFHMLGMNDSSGDRQREMFVKAVRMYQMMLAILGSKMEEGHPTLTSANGVKLYLAAVNNLGVIHCHFFDISKARVCLDRLIECSKNILNEDLFDSPAYGNIIMTVLLYGGKDIIDAAPAA